MKKIYFLFTALFLSLSFSHSQINMYQKAFMDIPSMHSTQLNDIWGYTDEVGNEYAIVGAQDGTSIVDITDTANLTEIAWIPGMNSIWRDIKVYDDYAYVTTEASEGLLIIDLSPLPGSTTLPTTIYNGPSGNEWYASHNLYQEDGYIYIFGADRGNGGVIILDVATDPMNPIEVGVFDEWYCHDGFVRNDTGYFSHVNDGFFTIVDLSDKTSVGLSDVIGSLTTSSVFTHNCWLSDDGNTLFTTDEVTDGFIDAYDISDPTNPVFLDKIQSSPGNNIIPHNTHVLGNYLVTSYYTDGVVVHDASNPSNMVEIANFDTSPSYNGGTFNGCWGVYPFFASGKIIASDTEEGLYVLGLNPTLSGYLQGNITNAGTGQPINNALVEILTTPVNGYSDVLGDYSVGTTSQGTFQVRYSAPGYYDDTLDIQFTNGAIVTQDVELQQIPLFTATVKVIDQSNQAVENAIVRIDHSSQSFEALTDVNGIAEFDLFYEDNYNISAGKWEYVTNCAQSVMLTTIDTSYEISISEGLYDDFTFDYGWTTDSTATSGFWVREKPQGTQSSGQLANPFSDNLSDCSNICYATGNNATTVGGDDIDDGSVTLISPVFDLSGYSEPGISFSYWFFNGFGGGAPNDFIEISLSNGTDSVLVETFSFGNGTMAEWTKFTINVSDFMNNTTQMQLIIKAEDVDPGHVLEAGLDVFEVNELDDASVKNPNNEIVVYPNPAMNQLTIQGVNTGTVTMYDLSGRVVFQSSVQSQLNIGKLNKGLYLLTITDGEGKIQVVQKQEIK